MNGFVGRLRTALGRQSTPFNQLIPTTPAPQPSTGSPETDSPAVGIAPDQASDTPRFRLRYTGHLTQPEFSARCAEVSPWYHSYYFDNGFEVPGDYDVGANVQDFGFPDNMSGMEVLDIGAGGGWYSHFFAERGASVTALDARGYGEFDMYGSDYTDETETRSPDAYEPDPALAGGRPLYFSPVSRSMWVMREIQGASIGMYNGRVYDVGPDLFGGKTFDLVFMGALLLHLRDPIGALLAARRVCRGQLVASNPYIEGEDPTPVQILPYTHIDRISWWLPNLVAYRHWFLAAGFRAVDVDGITHLRSDKRYLVGERVLNPDQVLRVARATV